MARYPCDADGRRYGGRQNTLYLSAYTDAGKRGWMLRLCSQHLEGAWAILASSTTDFESASLEEPICCPVCRRLEVSGYLVATFYSGDVPVKRAGCLCPEHVQELLKTIGVATQPQERD